MSPSPRLKTITGPNGRPLTLGDLPPVKPSRWFPSHKANVVAAVRGGLITAEQACKRYELTLEEFARWQQAFETQGVAGLKVMRDKNAQKTGFGSAKKT